MVDSILEKNQTLLHQKIKNYYTKLVNGKEEVTIKVNGNKYRIDVFDEKNNAIYEIQLKDFGKRFYEKISDLQKVNKVIIVHPITIKESLVLIERNKSDDKLYFKQKIVNKRNDYFSFFEKLVSFKIPFNEKQVNIHLLLIEEKVVKKFAYIRRGRPRYHTKQRDLLKIIDKLHIKTRNDFLNFLNPTKLNMPFTNNDLVENLSIKGGLRRKKKIAGCLTYSLCSLEILNRVGKKKNAFLFDIRPNSSKLENSDNFL